LPADERSTRGEDRRVFSAFSPLFLREKIMRRKIMRFMRKHLKQRKTCRESGQAMVEFALVVPFLIALLCFIIDFGWVLSCKNDLTNLAGQTARYAAIQVNQGNADADQVKGRVITYVADHGYNSRGAARTSGSDITIDMASGYVRVKLSENVNYLTGMTGVLTGHGTDVMLTAEAAAPIEVHN
jgi:Flp pilus assembly protein TadG